MNYPKRLIEVDLPIKRISAHARREKSIRHGHISTLHIWWARRPLAACRAVLCASLWPDPADELCPKEFVEFAKKEMLKWSDNDHLQLLSKESMEHFIKLNHDSKLINNNIFLRQLLLDFIADFANWDNSNQPDFLFSSRALTQSAHVALGGQPGTNPMVVDPFAGGGSIPLEALRIGADVFASDLNPIPVLINKVQLEYIPKYGKRLADEVRKWGAWVKNETDKDLRCFYSSIQEPKPEYYYPQIELNSSKQGKNWKFSRIVSEIPIAYIWARTVICEGPNCGTLIPLMRSTYLAKKGKNIIGLSIKANKHEKTVTFEIISDIKANETQGTIKRGSTTCPCCGYVTSVISVRKQLKERFGGANDARLIAVVTSLQSERACGNGSLVFEEAGRFFRLPVNEDLDAVNHATIELRKRSDRHIGNLTLIPSEPTPTNEGHRAVGSFFIYGIRTWGDLFTFRQNLSLIILQEKCDLIKYDDFEFEKAVKTVLYFGIDTIADHNTSVCTWRPTSLDVGHVFGRQALPMSWDFAEVNPTSQSTGSFFMTVDKVSRVIEFNSSITHSGTIISSSALTNQLPDDSASLFFTDPPYYDSVPYGDLSDLFYVWLKRGLLKYFPELFSDKLTPKKEQAIVWHPNSIEEKDEYERKTRLSMQEGRRIIPCNGIGVIVFAHKSTSGWESQLKSMIDAGWIITGSWPLDTELSSRINAMGTASLVSSVHLVCRPRENEDGSLIQDNIGDWRDVQEELPKRIHEWMPRLAEEGVAGADAIFACLGPALEIFSRYTKVVQAGSEREITLREYLEKVWAAVSQEALNMVFTGGEAQGLEEDARLTAMWLWTLTAGANDNSVANDEEENEDEETSTSGKLTGGFTLEYDTARKIAQGLGANLEDLKTLIEVKGDKARLLPVMERASKLFGATGLQQQPVKRKKKEAQLKLSFENVEPEEESKYEMPELKMEQAGKTVLDRLHQAMLLFSAGRSEALKRFLVEDGAGKDDRFWKLAQSLTSLYPKDTDERRWVEAVQTYKKSLGF